jgi:hypothetical protein
MNKTGTYIDTTTLNHLKEFLYDIKVLYSGDCYDKHSVSEATLIRAESLLALLKEEE